MAKKRKPYNKSTGRNYKRDYNKFQSSDKAKEDRAKRNKRRSDLEKKGRVRKGDGKDVHHKGNKVKVEPKSVNRGRTEKSRRKGSKRS